ncbi:FtsX-like permease family protein [Actinacidiphila rubida]|uniref:FtsX-like permease family protein n=1 Tax=Actinacidiphila rubida TaxID=310780 RepID=UPI000849CD24|nr:ABC transporter permease [Actinacidiphila rubida]
MPLLGEEQVLAVAMGMFAIGQGASWDRSQRDQADFAVGSDIRVTGMTTPPFGQAGIFASTPGIKAATPATRQDLLLTEQRHATALAVDTKSAGSTMLFRSDLTGGRKAADLMKPLQTATSGTASGPMVPGTTRDITFTATLTALGKADGRPDATATPAAIVANLTDAWGVDYPFSAGQLPADGRPHRLVLSLAAQSGSQGSPSGSLQLTGIDMAYAVPQQADKGRLTISAVQTTDRNGSTKMLRMPARSSWSSFAAYDNEATNTLPGVVNPAATDPDFSGGPVMTVDYTTGSEINIPQPYGETPGITLRLRTDHSGPLPALAGIATDSYLNAVGAKVGNQVNVQINQIVIPVRITAAVKEMPATGNDPTFSDAPATGASVDTVTQAKDAGALLLDLRALDQVLQANDARPLTPSEWWLATAPGDSAKVAAALRSRTDVDTVLVREESADELRGDPLGAGPQSALPAAVIAAAVLAAVGFAVASVGAIRERNGEFAVLRALGAPRRRLARMIAAEQGLLVLVSLIVGVVLGALLTQLVTPLIVLTTQATRPVPELRVSMPVGPLAELLGVVLVVPLLVVVATALRRGDPASALRRQGED